MLGYKTMTIKNWKEKQIKSSKNLPVQFVAHELEILEELLSTLPILPLLLVRQKIVRHHLRMQTASFQTAHLYYIHS